MLDSKTLTKAVRGLENGKIRMLLNNFVASKPPKENSNMPMRDVNS